MSGQRISAHSWPPRTSDRLALLHAYEAVLGWCLLANGVPVGAEEAEQLLSIDQTIDLCTRGSGFDLVSVPRAWGLDALVVIERGDARVPCVVTPCEVTFLVQPTTGQALSGLDFARVESGPVALLRLPPSSKTRWDTPPWLSTSPSPLNFPPAETLAVGLQQVAGRNRRHQPPR